MTRACREHSHGRSAHRAAPSLSLALAVAIAAILTAPGLSAGSLSAQEPDEASPAFRGRPATWTGGYSVALRGFGSGSGLPASAFAELAFFLDPIRSRALSPSLSFRILVPVNPWDASETLFGPALELKPFSIAGHPLEWMSRRTTRLSPMLRAGFLFGLSPGRDPLVSISILPFRLESGTGYFSFLGLDVVIPVSGGKPGWDLIAFQVDRLVF